MFNSIEQVEKVNTDREVWRCQTPRGLARISTRMTSRGRNAGRKVKYRIEFHHQKEGRAQTEVGVQTGKKLMTLKPGNRVFWIRKIACTKDGRKLFDLWVKDGMKRSIKMAEQNEFEHAKQFGVHAIYSGGLPSLGKKR
jgi:hypothetical protein